MFYRLLDVLSCPICNESFRVYPFDVRDLSGPKDNLINNQICENCSYIEHTVSEIDKCSVYLTEDIIKGIIHCSNDHFFPIINGIPRIWNSAFSEAADVLKGYFRELPLNIINLINRNNVITDDKFENKFRHTQNSFSSQWIHFSEKGLAWGEDITYRNKIFLSCFNINKTDLYEKKILDAGCGHGELEISLLQTGAEIFATDLSYSVDGVRNWIERSYPEKLSSVHLVQANIHHLPFKNKIFDFVYSAGVLHHTPDTLQGFKAISSKLKEGGKGYIEVYSAELKNPIAHFISNILRIITTRLPHSLLHMFCYMGAPLLWYYTRLYNWSSKDKLYPIRTLSEFELSLFDNFSPQYQFHHTTEEVKNWFTQLGYDKIEKTLINKNGFGIVGTLLSK